MNFVKQYLNDAALKAYNEAQRVADELATYNERVEKLTAELIVLKNHEAALRNVADSLPA